jgi:peroxiredoxin
VYRVLQDIARPAQVAAEPLRGIDGGEHSLASLAEEKATVVVFMANGCPTVRNYEERLKAAHAMWRAAGVQLVAINSNNPSLSPADTLAEMAKRASTRRFTFPYLKDREGVLAKAFAATCTPHAFVLDKDLRIVYEGRIDDSRMGTRVTCHDLSNAVAEVIAGRRVGVERTEPFGCGIVW